MIQNPTTSYLVHVKTGDRFGAGTDANVYLKLYGENGRSNVLQLKNKSKKRCQLDEFVLTDVENVGAIEKIEISHDNTGIGPSWFLEYVEISHPSSRLTFRFPCHKWLRKIKDDLNETTSIILKCTEIFQGPACIVQPATGVRKSMEAEVSKAIKPNSYDVNMTSCNFDGKMYFQFHVNRQAQLA